MTNHWCDIGNSDCILIIGSNAAENHPVSFKWVLRAKDKGAKLISVDPRFTRTSAKADIYAPLRSGTDIAFIGGMIKYILDNELYHKDYVVNYTNASFLIKPGFDFNVNSGMFSGFDPASKSYKDKSAWQYDLDANGVPKKDPTLQDPQCAFQLLKKHFERYTPEMVCKVTGTPADVYEEVCKAYAATGQSGKSGTIMYAMGTTQHTHGTQNIRSYAIMQLLLGNIGVAGGGINALRGESNVQGSTDHCLLFHILPGYLGAPTVSDASLEVYCKNKGYYVKSKDPKSADWWSNGDKYIVSMLKAFYGDNATDKNDFCFGHLPKSDGNYSHISLFEAMYQGIVKGFMLWGQNPAVGGPNAMRERAAMTKLEWMVAVDLWETETAAFWKEPGVDPKTIDTEVFFLPAAGSYEKEGSIVNSGRWAQWRYKAVDAPGDARDDLWMIDMIARELKKLYAAGGKYSKAITDLMWDYGEHADPHKVAKEINGYYMSGADKGKQVASFAKLAADGSTCSGNWLYCNSYTEDGNMMARRSKEGNTPINIYPKWSWCWPVNRRIIYNRASVDLNGKPWDAEHAVIEWKEGKWVGDVPDGGWPPMAVDAEKTKYPFIMKPEGFARLFGAGLADGPFPEHYEPMETPLAANPFNGSLNTPSVYVYDEKCGPNAVCPPNVFAAAGGPFPIVCTTYRLTEHWQAGMMTRNLPWLNELMPEPFVEMSEELAAAKGIENGQEVKVITIRGTVKLKAAVTKRFKPFKVNGGEVHQVGVIWHWGYCGASKGASANLLTPHVGDVNTRIPEFKAFLCEIEKA